MTPVTICSVSGTPLSRSSWISSFMRFLPSPNTRREVQAPRITKHGHANCLFF
jgi:hypothetical protein